MQITFKKLQHIKMKIQLQPGVFPIRFTQTVLNRKEKIPRFILEYGSGRGVHRKTVSRHSPSHPDQSNSSKQNITTHKVVPGFA